jgi:integrase
MPQVQRGSAYKIAGGRWGLRYYDLSGARRRKSPFPSKSAALRYYREIVEPELRGEDSAVAQVTLRDFVPLFLDRHAATVRARTIQTLRHRLSYAVAEFGDELLCDVERKSGEIAAWQASKLPKRARYGIMQALRQALGAAVRWGYMQSNPAIGAGANPQPSPRGVRAFSRAELEAIGVELSGAYRTLPAFVAATGLRPEEWQALARGDIDVRGRVVNVRRTVSGGEMVELGKTDRSRRQVPLSRRGAQAVDVTPPRGDTRLLYAAPEGGVLNLDNFRRREWAPAIKAAGVATPARIYDLRSTFASDALAAGVTVFELARIMGTSVDMIERHYGTLLDGAGAAIAGRLDALDAERDRCADEDASEGVDEDAEDGAGEAPAGGPIVAQTAFSAPSGGAGVSLSEGPKTAVNTGDPDRSSHIVAAVCEASQAEGRGFEARRPLRSNGP